MKSSAAGSYPLLRLPGDGLPVPFPTNPGEQQLALGKILPGLHRILSLMMTLGPSLGGGALREWWWGKDSNLRSLRSRFTVCPL